MDADVDVEDPKLNFKWSMLPVIWTFICVQNFVIIGQRIKKLSFCGCGCGCGCGSNLAYVTFALILYLCTKFGKNQVSSFCINEEQTNRQTDRQIYNAEQIYIYRD